MKKLRGRAWLWSLGVVVLGLVGAGATGATDDDPVVYLSNSVGSPQLSFDGEPVYLSGVGAVGEIEIFVLEHQVFWQVGDRLNDVRGAAQVVWPRPDPGGTWTVLLWDPRNAEAGPYDVVVRAAEDRPAVLHGREWLLIGEDCLDRGTGGIVLEPWHCDTQ